MSIWIFIAFAVGVALGYFAGSRPGNSGPGAEGGGCDDR